MPGIPDELYCLPHFHGFDHCGLTLSANDKENVLDRRDIYNEAEIAKKIDDEPHDFASYKVIRIPESRKFLLVESGLPGIGIQILICRIPRNNESSHSFTSVIKFWVSKAIASQKGVGEPCWVKAHLIFPHLIYLEFQWLERFS